MRAAELVTLNMRELDRLKVIQDVADGRLNALPPDSSVRLL
ncbi:hypothetical protein [Paraburkholderia gardini]|uniref:Uncharacterized protein n=1 Tax=Paraburkholderia gardini TaxID=2823469 RepID=A0ABM8TXV2_9BURK|nr:hypothetical protein [Paraburkholderia gardini]CAG4887329.1 hypothetical protein R54767_00297 [Paraburkholderia gardini]CAG4899135.1 hypothetical protein R69919_02563 [Paraburkholderia gardini]